MSYYFISYTIFFLPCFLGIKKESNLLGPGYEFITNSSPFSPWASGNDEINCKRFASHLLADMHKLGYRLIGAGCLSRTQDLTTWVFHREQIAPADYRFACIGFSQKNILQLIEFPPALHDLIKDAVEKHCKIKESKNIEGCLQMKFKEDLWRSSNTELDVKAKTIIKSIIHDLNSRQWVLYSSSYLVGQGDTLFFMYNPLLQAPFTAKESLAISLLNTDRLRLIDASDSATCHVKDVILNTWKRGIQQEKKKFNSTEFKLAGRPWMTRGKESAASRQLLCRLFEGLMTIGWKIQTAVHLTVCNQDKCMLTFNQCSPVSAQVFCLSFNSTSKIRIINAPSDLEMHLLSEIRKVWLLGIDKEHRFEECFEVALKGCPWGDEHDGAHARVLLLYLINSCLVKGWYLIFSADVSSVIIQEDELPDCPWDVYSWWFMRSNTSPPPALPSAPLLF